jgi:hypothetical protein
LYLSIKSMALNPIPDIIKIEVDPIFLGNIDMIVDTLSKNDSITDIRYKPDEVVAIMHIEFYKRLLFLIIGITVALVFVILVSAVLYVGVGGVLSSFGESVKWFFDGVFGSLCGILSVYFIVYPTKYISQLWYWPEFYYNLCVLISGGVVGWVLYQWKKS